MTIPTLTTLPVAPARTDPPATFVTRADAFLAAIVTFQGEMNTSIGAMNTDIAQVNADATAAAASETAAALSAEAAANAAGAALWVSGQAYAEGDAAISLVNYQTYRAETATSGTTDPSLDANWTAISGTFPVQTGNAGKFLSTDGSDPSWAEISSSPTLQATTSGALENGDTVIINSDGTVSVVASEVVESFDSSAAVTYGASNYTDQRDITYDSVNNKVIIFYNNSNVLYAQVGTVSENNITFGAAVIAQASAATYPACAYDPVNEKVVFAYYNGGLNKGSVRLGTISGDTISFGGSTDFKSGAVNNLSVVYDENSQKFVISYHDLSSPSGKSAIATVSGSSISFGSTITFNSGTTTYIDSTYDSDSQKVIITYEYVGNITAIVGTISGTSISFGSPATTGDFGTAIDYGKIAYDPTAQRVVMVGMVGANGGGRCYVGTVSGTSISFSTPIYFSAVQYGYWPAIVYDSLAGKCVVVSGASVAGTANAYLITISGDTPTASSPYEFATTYAHDFAIAYDSNSQVSVTHGLSGTNGLAFVIQAAELSTSLTSENYIGISDGAYADAATATILVDGSVSEAQTGLTAGQDYYIQVDGSLALTSGVPSVLAGTATSATNLLIRTNKVPSLTGNSGKFLTTDGASTSWGSVSAGMTLLNTYAASGQATVDIEDFDATYDDYMIVMSGMISSTDFLDFQLKIGGTWQTGSNYTYTMKTRTTYEANSGTSAIRPTYGGRADIAAFSPADIIVNALNVNAGIRQGIFGTHRTRYSYWEESGTFSGSYFGSQGVLGGIRVKPRNGAGTITGNIKIYGIAKA